ncbi:hypothetical protein FACS1894172_04600 [Spirochaetia bacterium]|nr:hypothetical protein FACS1894164_12640 [Spirochaetia bacterium]GHU30785.1 hypothetical protein FACS1894172_04600 [Spirochaetia bacterium]
MKVLTSIAIIVLVCSCASVGPQAFSGIDDALNRGDYRAGAALLERNRSSYYRNNDTLLYYLDRGMLEHYAGNYAESASLLQNAERSIENAFTKSISMEISSYIINDTVKEYDGEDYEDIYINAFNALSYYHSNSMEKALVEIRRMSTKLEQLSVKYDGLINNLQRSARDSEVDIPPDSYSGKEFNNSVFGRYLGMLFYRGAGRSDDARIDSTQLKRAFTNAPHIYNFPLPSSINDELTIPAGMARLNVIGFAGLSPQKSEETLRIPVSRSMNYVKIALPVMKKRRSEIARIEVLLNNGTRFNLELLENIGDVAVETFRKKSHVIYLKSVMRAVIKGIGTETLRKTAEQKGDTLSQVLSFGSQVFTELSEQADLRVSRYFPDKVYVGGCTVRPGTYFATINYYSPGGRLIQSESKTLNVQAQGLNLIESVCLR